MNNKIFGFFISLLTISLLAWVGCNNKRETELIKEGNEVVEKIEKYRQKFEKLPNSLTDIGLKEQDGMDVLYYYKRDSIHYTVSFPISAEEHKFYYSDSKQWENGYRDMK